ncbi:MAG: dipeptide epimerase [Bdellovibrionaceae bacterium]|nr:dipeptide epimerase [Bdellovibrionales bacterium]MCB9254226.1 dipeptide epimerase [Pseudobdellovibrionaceae bacterium]
MKIENIEVWKESFALVRPYTIAFRTISEVDNIIVKLVSGDKLGLGAASPERFVTGETLEATEAALKPERLEFLKGSNLEQSLEHLKRDFHSTPAARAAVEIALYDLVAQEAGKPLVEFFGRKHKRLPTSITIGIKGVRETLDEAEEYIGRGFSILKVKLGKDFELDIERVLKLREAIGDDVRVRLDMNQGYGPKEVVSFWERAKAAHFEFVEQPMLAAATGMLRSLPADIRKQIAADESLLSPEDAKALVSPEPACGIFNIKLMKCGGPSSARMIAQTAADNGIELMWGCMDESAISIAAALHTAYACSATRYLDLDGSFDLGRDLVEGGFVVEKGEMYLTDAPGLGVRLLG